MGVHEKRKENDYGGHEPMGVLCGTDDDALYYMGIVDILTEYGLRKTAETFCCGTLKRI